MTEETPSHPYNEDQRQTTLSPFHDCTGTSLHQGLVGLMNAGRIHEAHVVAVEAGDVGREEKTQQSSQETKKHHLGEGHWGWLTGTTGIELSIQTCCNKTFLCGPHGLAPCQAHAPIECTK